MTAAGCTSRIAARFRGHRPWFRRGNSPGRGCSESPSPTTRQAAIVPPPATAEPRERRRVRQSGLHSTSFARCLCRGARRMGEPVEIHRNRSAQSCFVESKGLPGNHALAQRGLQPPEGCCLLRPYLIRHKERVATTGFGPDDALAIFRQVDHPKSFSPPIRQLLQLHLFRLASGLRDIIHLVEDGLD